VGKFATFSERPKAKSVSALEGLRPLTSWPGALPLDPVGGSAPRPPITEASHLYLGGTSNSLTPALRSGQGRNRPRPRSQCQDQCRGYPTVQKLKIKSNEILLLLERTYVRNFICAPESTIDFTTLRLMTGVAVTRCVRPTKLLYAGLG